MAAAPAKAEAFQRLHAGPDLLVLPNAWDVATARLIERLGFPAVATTSVGMAEALGYADGGHTPPEEMLGAVGRMAAAVQIPVTADLENGYGLPGDELALRAAESGAVGFNLEDSDHTAPGNLVDAEAHAARIAAAHAARPELVINARVDVYVRKHPGGFEEALRRGRLYLEAGATCVYPIILSDEEEIGALVGALRAPVNIHVNPDWAPLHRLAELGVRRVSYGGSLFKAALEEVRRRIEPPSHG
ncbi:MAG TPA: isocitrate lyase/phosphoenolpyruvate mutase family protein [Solirubrobacteraceae bacterium]